MTLKTQTKTIVAGYGDFNAEARDALARLQAAVRRVVAEAPESASRPTDIGRVFGLDYALAWQIHALSGKPNLLMTARTVPKAGAMERFILAAERLTSHELAHGVREAYEAFESTVERLAGNRDTFDAMITLQRPKDRAGLVRARRTAHRANAAVWGVTCKCKAHMAVFRVRPSGEFDALTVLGYVGLQRLHMEAVISTLASTRVWGGPHQMPSESARATLECELIEEACSRPLPTIEHTIAPDGTSQEYLGLNGLGRKSEASVFWRTLALAAPNTTSAPPHSLTSTCRIPTEHLVMDFLIPRGWVNPESVQAWITPDQARYMSSQPDTPYRLPFEGEPAYLGADLSVLHSAEVPRWADLIRSEIDRMRWSETEFDIFRCEVEYPIHHSAAHMRVE